MHEMEMESVTVEIEKTTTLNYHESPYEDSRYEVVGEPPGEEVFLPLEIQVIDDRVVKADPMFHDFGGATPDNTAAIWHMPTGEHSIKFGDKKDDKEREEELRQQFAAELETARTEAFEAGRQAGLQEAQASIEQNNQQVNARVGGIIKDIVSQVNEKVREIERESIQFVVNLTDKIIPHAVEINPEYILPILQEALGLAETAVIKRVRVSPADLEFINVVGLYKSIKEFDATWEFSADETIRAGCVIETSAGEVVYDLDKAWQRVKQNVAKVVR